MPTQMEQIIADIEELAANEWKWSVGTKGIGGEARARYDAFSEAADIVRKHIETEEQSRQRFEAWLLEAWLLSCGDVRKYLERDSNGRYRDNDTDVAWQAWQASQTFTEASE